MPAEIVERFRELFEGFNKVYFTYTLDPTLNQIGSPKLMGRPNVIRQPVTVEIWEQHLNGIQSIGITPVNEAGMAKFGAIDVDKYETDHAEIFKRIKENSLPLVPIRSKSGGLHLYLFFRDFITADLMRSKLREFAAFLSIAKSEIFPKQSQIIAERGDVGSWINMPYFNMKQTNRYAYNMDADPLDAESFIYYALQRRLQNEDALRLSTPSDVNVELGDKDLPKGSPPCLILLSRIKVDSGGRNNALLAFGTLAKKVWPDKWQEKLRDWNTRFMNPPLPLVDVNAVVGSLSGKDYNYRCSDAPIANYCDSQRCRQSRYGVGGNIAGTGLPVEGTLVCQNSDPIKWFMNVDGSANRLEITTEQFYSQRQYAIAVMAACKILPPAMKQPEWAFLLTNLLRDAQIVEPIPGSTPEELFRELLFEFLGTRNHAETMDEITRGRVYKDEKAGYYWFQFIFLKRFLLRAKADFDDSMINTFLNRLSYISQRKRIGGKQVAVIAVPFSDGDEQTEPYETPTTDIPI